MTDPLVAAEGCSVRYQRGAQAAVDGVTFAVGPGDGLLVTGAEGAGKSALLRAIAGLVRAEGRLEVVGTAPADAARQGRVGFGPQGRTFADRRTPRELVRLVAALRTRSWPQADPRALAEEALERAGLEPAGRDARALELEDVRRLALACAIAADPPVVLLDDPWEFRETHAECRSVRERGGCLMIATDDPGGLPALVDGRVLRLVEGVPA